MKILIVSGAFFPGNSPRSFRTTELTKELCRQGHHVTVYFPENEYDYSKFCEEFAVDIRHFKRHSEKRHFTGISIIDRVIFRFLNQFCAYPSICDLPTIKEAVSNENGYDLLITVAVPHSTHWAFGKLYQKGKKAAKVWVADCGDPFMLMGSSNYRPPFYLKSLETRWCRQCNYITVPTETSYLGYYPEFRDKIRVIPQGFNFEATELLEYKKNEVPTFAFAGSFIPGIRDPRRLFEYLVNSDKPYRFVVYGTSDKSRWADLIEQSKGQIVFEKPIPRPDLLKALSKMDFLINIGNGTNVQTPSKLIDYTLTKRPILTIETTDIKENILNEFLDGNYEHKDADIDISKYDIRNVTQQFLDLCK